MPTKKKADVEAVEQDAPQAEEAPEFVAGWNDPPAKAVIDRSREGDPVDPPVGRDGGPVSPNNPEAKAAAGPDRATGYLRDEK